jgi:hypothetical protein
MARKTRPPSDNMDNIATVLAAGPMTWQQIQAGLERDFGWMHGAVLIGVLNAMIRRNLIVQEGDHCGLVEHREDYRAEPDLHDRIEAKVTDACATVPS